jgi:hypothetical protein
VTTVKYGLSVLQGIFTENPLDIVEGGNLTNYCAELLKGDDGAAEKQFKNEVVRSWNGIIQSAESKDREEMEMEIQMLTDQLQELDDIFVTHFSKVVRFFMTSSTSWTSMIPMYVEALGKYADEMAQQPGGPPLLKKIRQGLPEKLAWVMTNHRSLHMAPAFPLMTKSVVSIVADSLLDIGLAVYEVSGHPFYRSHVI